MHSQIFAAMRTCFKHWFPQRNLIIVSEHKVRHLPISGIAQFIMVTVFAGGVCWGAYSTGSYMAARMTLKVQNQALRSIAGARVATNFNTMYPSSPLMPADAADATDATPLASLASPMYTLSALNNDKLFARVAFLEQRVTELQSVNANIIQRVREKTAGRITGLENIIRQAGLNPSALKKELSEKKPDSTHSADAKSEGGPFIPDDLSNMPPETASLYSNLDELALIQQVVDTLPLAYPVKQSEEQSGFGRRIDPFTGRLAFHSGLDLSAPPGSRIYSTAPGKVVAAERNGAYGNMVDIEHGFGIVTRYAHLSQILVREGQVVKKGAPIGVQGSTGRSTGQHVHYEVRINDKAFNPKNFLKAGQYVFEE